MKRVTKAGIINNDYLFHDQYLMETFRTSSLPFEFYKFLLLIFKVIAISFLSRRAGNPCVFFLIHSVRSLSAEMSSGKVRSKKSERNIQWLINYHLVFLRKLIAFKYLVLTSCLRFWCRLCFMDEKITQREKGNGRENAKHGITRQIRSRMYIIYYVFIN